MIKRIILVGGDIAAGKSTYAKKIADKLNIPYFLKDTFKEILSDTIGYQNRQENRALSNGVFHSMIEIANRLMEKEISFVLESNFRQFELDELEKLTKKYRYNSLILLLQGDYQVLHKRYLDRIDKGRHKTHLVVDLTDFNTYKEHIIKTRKIKPFGDFRIIDASDFSYQDDDTLFL